MNVISVYVTIVVINHIYVTLDCHSLYVGILYIFEYNTPCVKYIYIGPNVVVLPYVTVVSVVCAAAVSSTKNILLYILWSRLW